MFSSNMFDGMITMLIVVGLLAGLIIAGIPMYFVGRYYGKQAVYSEAMQEKVLEIKFDPNDGTKLYIWRKPNENRATSTR